MALPVKTGLTAVTPTDAHARPTATTGVCPLQGCSAGVSNAAQGVISLINQVTLASENLQQYARQIGSKKRTLAARVSGITQVINGLRTIVVNLGTIVARITVLPPFPPGCDSDTIVVALVEFVRVHQALLNIIIGRAGLLSNLPFVRREVEDVQEAAVQLVRDTDPVEDLEPRLFNPVGAVLAGVLRSLEAVVDSVAFALIGLIPTRQQCLQGQKVSIDGTLDDAIAAYSS